MRLGRSRSGSPAALDYRRCARRLMRSATSGGMDLPVCAARNESNAPSFPAFALLFGAFAMDVTCAQMACDVFSVAVRRQMPEAVTVTVKEVLALVALPA